MKTILALVGALALVGCDSVSPPVKAPIWAGKMQNACLPEAAVMARSLEEKGIPAHVLVMNFLRGTERWGHAVCVYQFQGRTWAWDSYWKSLRISPAWPNADSEAAAYLRARADLRGAAVERSEVL